ncbi:hypothetical protein [Gulosibacter sp. 10]|uniref:hypothetical protein n=1 Tax=Gulosibacter sp. 10 TaxID=1255570 RepID=UPI00097F4ACC|nr:hypothetical protein [Gulosibacter sp. 10]SJM70179.1 putative integral membrane protein [Gulosibacter sp. 10]
MSGAGTRPTASLRLGPALRAERIKLRTLPAALATVIATPLAGAALGAAFAASARDGAALESVLASAMPFLQIGTILLAVYAVASEYSGRQISASLRAVPRRGALLAAKGALALASTAVLAAVAVLATAAGAAAVLLADGFDSLAEADWARMLGGIAYLVLIGALAFGFALLVRRLMPALAGMLTAVLILSPLLRAQTEHARWLPDAAGSQLFAAGGDPVLTPLGGALVLLAWVVAVGAAGALRFARSDA